MTIISRLWRAKPRTSPQGLELIKFFEGFRANAYQDSVGVWTIGYGSTKNVKEGDTTTEAKAAARLLEELARTFEPAVTESCKHLKLNTNQYDALVSFTYNVGQGNLRLLIKDRQLPAISYSIPKYCKAGGKVLEGLRIRREVERELFDAAPGTTLDLARLYEKHAHNVKG
jgi:lysozyme